MMKVINSIKESLAKLTPEQQKWMPRLLLVVGIVLVARPILNLWPSTATVLIMGAIFAVALLCYAKFILVTPNRRGLVKWLIPLSVGGSLNFSVRLANGGFMPSANQVTTRGIYIPMDGANLIYLGDWIAGFISPGDFVVLAAFVGMMVTLIWPSQQHALVEETMTELEAQ